MDNKATDQLEVAVSCARNRLGTGVDYLRQVLELCSGERREEMRDKALQDLLSFDAKSWKRDARYSAFM